ncbi:hypothetical protein [Aristophania vespae]|uniref:hypothetical protein n=1 Tax=Aristophania vespae TaxID=2697033 RepID=UPI00235127F8|nr:hypothetical protein [Aristophania vespae]UMM63091.1 hypothetical protein DM15PD_00450 [Aristophania vespae]
MQKTPDLDGFTGKTLTEKQIKQRQIWPDRYYAYYNPLAQKPVQILGWYDLWDDYDEETIPDKENLFPLSLEQWDWHNKPGNSQAQINENGTITIYQSPPLPGPTLKQLAERQLSEYQEKSALITAMGKRFGPKTCVYLEELFSLIQSDPKSGVLPDEPPDPFL